MAELKLMRKKIDLNRSEILFSERFTQDRLARDWTICSGEWWVEDGCLLGRNPENAPGQIISKVSFTDDILMDFEGETVLPSAHDIDWMWNISWNEDHTGRGFAYVAGLQGWWDGKVGFEKAPDYRLVAGTPLFDFAPGRTYHIQSGSIDGHCFVFVDGRLLIELMDPDPISLETGGHIGFEAYASYIRIRNLVVRRIAWEAVEEHYMPEW